MTEGFSQEQVIAALRRSGHFRNGADLRLSPIQAKYHRHERDAAWAIYICETGQQNRLHITVSGSDLSGIHARHAALAAACPEITCKPMFALQGDGDTPHILAREYFEGETLHDATVRGACTAEQCLACANELRRALEATTVDSTPQAREEELAALEASVLRAPLLGELDRLILSQWIFPLLRGACESQPARIRWSNGDFHAMNILIDQTGRSRLIDYEHAARTHFAGVEWIQLRLLSHLPDEALPGGLDLPAPDYPELELYFWLCFIDHTARELDSAPYFVRVAMEHLLRIAAAASNDKSHAISLSDNRSEALRIRERLLALQAETAALKKETKGLRRAIDAWNRKSSLHRALHKLRAEDGEK